MDISRIAKKNDARKEVRASSFGYRLFDGDFELIIDERAHNDRRCKCACQNSKISIPSYGSQAVQITWLLFAGSHRHILVELFLLGIEMVDDD